MPNQRAQDKELVTLWMSGELAGGVEAGRKKLRGISRSQFIRDAVQERLAALGIGVEDDKVVAPDRSGKGGPKVKYPERNLPAVTMNDQSKSSSSRTSALIEKAPSGLAKALREARSQRPSRSTGGPISYKGRTKRAVGGGSKSRPESPNPAPK